MITIIERGDDEKKRLRRKKNKDPERDLTFMKKIKRFRRKV